MVCLLFSGPAAALSGQDVGPVRATGLDVAGPEWPVVMAVDASASGVEAWAVEGPRSTAVGLQMVAGIVGGLAGAGLVTGAFLLSQRGQPDDGWGKLAAIGIGVVPGPAGDRGVGARGRGR